MKRFFISIAAAIILLMPMTASAAYLRASNSNSETIGTDQNPKNAYIAGSNLTIDAKVQKDLNIAGSNLTINGSVENNLMAAANVVTVKGSVGDSLRVAGADISIDNTIGGDALIAGNNITLSEKSKVDGDLLAVGNRIELKGTVLGAVKMIGSNVIISGKVTGDVYLRDVQNLTITKDAVISGKLTYYSQNQANIESGGAVGSIDYHNIQGQDKPWSSYSKGASMTYSLYQIIGSILLLLLLIFIAPKNARKFVEYSHKEIFRNLWWGLLILIVTPVISVLLIAISFKLSAILFLAYILALILASVFSALLAGSWLLKTLGKVEAFPIDWQSVILGVLILALLSFVPILGSLILFMLLLIALGSLAKLTYDGIAQ